MATVRTSVSFPRARAPERHRASYFLLVAALGLGLAAGALCLAHEDAHDWRLAADITTPDSVPVAAALRARRTGHLYQPWTAPPFTPTPYGPAYYGALVALSEITGPHFNSLLLAGRLLTFGCFLGVVALVYGCGRRLGLGGGLALLGAGLAASDAGFADWSLSTRPDMAALLASLGAIYVASGLTPARRGRGREIGVGLLLAAAVLAKQSYVAAPLAVALCLTARRQWAGLARIAGTAVAAVAAVLGALVVHGDAVLPNLLALRQALPAVATGVGLVLRACENYVPHVLLLALAAVGLGAAWRARRNGPAALVALYAVLAWLIGIATLLANSGGGDNYLLEGWAAAAILAAYGLDWLRRDWAGTPAAARALLVAWVALSAGAGIVTWHHRAFTEQPADHARLARALRGERVFSDVPYLALQGRDPVYLDPYLLRTLEVAGRWRSEKMISALRARRFDVLLLDDAGGSVNTVWRGLSHFDAATMGAIAAYYRPACQIYPVVAYLPKHEGGVARARLIAAGCRELGHVRVHGAVP